MLPVRKIEIFNLASQIPNHFTFSEAAIKVIGNQCQSWLEGVNLLIEHKCFSDAIMLIACGMPIPAGTIWVKWCIDNITSPNIKFENMENHPSVWLEAANFWHQQYLETGEYHLENLAKEAVYSAVYLCARADNFTQIAFLRILEKGLTLHHS